MLNNGTKMVFDVDANQIKVKKLLKKDFLELSMKAISSANPNLNGSWFTPEAMEKALPTFYNKPILGCFSNGDFESHNGEWTNDDETGLSYWDTLGAKGERILGLIRSEDKVEVIEENGLKWISLTCALWTQYSFKQVKRLLKDAIRSQKEGGPTKNISVEVDILDYEKLPNGVFKINDFKLVGITILGSRNGRKVEPGIKDAELSVLDMIGTDNYERQKSELRMAYAKLNGDEAGKEEEDMDEKDIPQEEEKKEVFEEEHKVEEEPHEEPVEEKDEPAEEPKADECADFGHGEEPHEEPHEDPCEDEDDHNGHEGEEHCEPECGEDPKGKSEEELHEDSEEHHCEECEKYRAECEELREKCSAAEDGLAKLQECYDKLKCDHDDLMRKYEEAEKKIAAYEAEKFACEAKQFVLSAGCEKSIADRFCKECDEGKYHDIDTLKKDIAVAVFDSNRMKVGNSGISLPISNPEVFSGDQAEKSPKKKSSWDTLNAYNKGEK